MFDKTLRDYALQRLRAGRTHVRLSASVHAVLPNKVVLSTGENLPCGLVVWSTGVGPRPFLHTSGLALDPKGLRLQTDPMLRVPGTGETVFALGDCAAVGDKVLPAVAQVAEQQGRWLATQFNAEAAKQPAWTGPFDFHNQGMLAYLGCVCLFGLLLAVCSTFCM
jgi:NADH:ubiquinone reductase (non-electrogenic)